MAGAAGVKNDGHRGTWRSGCSSGDVSCRLLATVSARLPLSLFALWLVRCGLAVLVWAMRGVIGRKGDHLFVGAWPLHPPVAAMLCPVVNRGFAHMVWCQLGAVGAGTEEVFALLLIWCGHHLGCGGVGGEVGCEVAGVCAAQ